jgi:hypothetical protein
MDKQRSSAAAVIAALLLLLPALYVGSYMALVQPTTVFFTGGGQRLSLVIVNYRLGGTIAERAFWPLEQLDRLVRPSAWRAPPIPMFLSPSNPPPSKP